MRWHWCACWRTSSRRSPVASTPDIASARGSLLPLEAVEYSRSTCCVRRPRPSGNRLRDCPPTPSWRTTSPPLCHCAGHPTPLATGTIAACLGLKTPAGVAGCVAPGRVGVSRVGKEGRAGAFPARNDTERGTPARRGAVAQNTHERQVSAKQSNDSNEPKPILLSAPKPPPCSVPPPRGGQRNSGATPRFLLSHQANTQRGCAASQASLISRESGRPPSGWRPPRRRPRV